MSTTLQLYRYSTVPGPNVPANYIIRVQSPVEPLGTLADRITSVRSTPQSGIAILCSRSTIAPVL